MTLEIGVSLPYVNRITRGREQLVNKTFLKMMNELGYDIELSIHSEQEELGGKYLQVIFRRHEYPVYMSGDKAGMQQL